MTAGDIFKVYQRTGVETAPPYRLVAMLYEGAISRCREAAAALDNSNYEVAYNSLLKAQAIVAELLGGLDMAAGGELARHLYAQYEYMHRRLVTANIKRDAAAAREVAELLGELNDAWRRIGAPAAMAAGAGRLALSS